MGASLRRRTGFADAMHILRSRLALITTIAALGALPACGTDDAVERDAKEAQQDIDKGAGNVDEEAGDAAKDAGDEIEDAADKAEDGIDENTDGDADGDGK